MGFQMLQLLKDPETVPFLKEDQVNLALLKQEIDRRILKVKDLVNRKSKKASANTITISLNERSHKQVQTEPSAFYSNISLSEQEAHVLCPSKQFHPNIESTLQYESETRTVHTGCKASLSRQNGSRPSRQNKEKNGSAHRHCHTLGQEMTLLESNGFTFRVNEPSQRDLSTFRKHTLESEVDYAQSYLDIGEQYEFPDHPHSDLYNSTIEGRFRDRRTLSPLQQVENPMRDIGRMSFFTDLSSSNHTKTEVSHPRRLRNKSRTQHQEQDIIMPEADHRIIVGQQCLQKMRGSAESLVGRRRKQFWDNKLRLNVLKRIEERYGREMYEG